ncbi:MAG TPA: MFS transporter [Burkholderiales bacterium]|nr:MFS transporter [Burkholderiales bacterium]
MTDWRAVWIVFAAGLAAGAYMTKVPPALPAMRAELGVGLVQSGFIHTVMYAIGAVAGVFGGAAADRFGQKRFALAGLALLLTGGVLGALSSSFGPVLVSRFLEGLGFMLLAVAAAPLIVAATQPVDRPTAFSIWSCYMPTGGTLILLVAPLALGTLGWRSLWLGLAAYTALCIVLVARWVPTPAFGGRIGSARLLRESLVRPGLLLLCVAFICYAGQWISVMTWLPTFLVGERAAGPAAASLLTAAFVAINIPGNLLGGWLLKRRVPRWAVMAAGATAMGICATGLLAPQSPDALRFLCLLAFSLLGGLVPGSVFSGAAAHAKSAQHVGTANGMVMQASHLSQFVVPIVIAWVATRLGGWSASLGVMLALSAIGVAAGLAVRGYERKL